MQPTEEIMTREVLTPELVEALKQIYPKLYKVVLFEQEYAIAPITKLQWNFIQEAFAKNPKMDINDKIISDGLVWPDWTSTTFDNLPAGISEVLANHILARSGFKTNLPVSIVEDIATIQEAESLWEAPTDADIEEIKAKNPGRFLQRVTLDNEVFIIRPLNRTEWNNATKSVDMDSALLTKGIIFPEKLDLKVILPGVLARLVEAIGIASGFKEDPVSSEEL